MPVEMDSIFSVIIKLVKVAKNLIMDESGSN